MRLVADLPSVAVGAVKDATIPLFAHARDLGQFVDEAGRHEQPSADDLFAVVHGDCEPVDFAADFGDLAVDDLAAVALHFVSASGQQLCGADAFESEEPMDPLGRSIARVAGIDDCHPPACAGQGQASAESGRTGSDDHDVSNRALLLCHVLVLSKVCGVAAAALRYFDGDNPFAVLQTGLPNGKVRGMDELMDRTLDAVGPRLKQLRQRRDITLTDLSEKTRIVIQHALAPRGRAPPSQPRTAPALGTSIRGHSRRTRRRAPDRGSAHQSAAPAHSRRPDDSCR